MSLSDRPYWREDGGAGSGQGGRGGRGGRGLAGGMTIGFPRPTRTIKYLLAINIGMFFAQLIFKASGVDLAEVLGATVAGWWQVWRYLTFQFLHSTGTLWHLGLNMLGLYMLGTPLERQWGRKRFLTFYLSCGAFAGLAYVAMAAMLSLDSHVPLIGASGGVYAILLACAVLFPHFRLIFFLFPVPIRLAAVVIFAAMGLTVFGSLSAGQAGPGFWSDVAHLGGAGAGAFWIWALPRLRGEVYKRRRKFNQGAWQRRMDKLRRQQQEIDDILDQIRAKGLASLTRAQREKLKQSTVKQQEEEKNLYDL